MACPIGDGPGPRRSAVPGMPRSARWLLPEILPEPWATFAFIGLLAGTIRAWPVLRAGEWWEEAWAYGVILAALAVLWQLTPREAGTPCPARGAAPSVYYPSFRDSAA